MRLPEPECRRRLLAARVALLAVNDAGGSPLAVPITFAVLERPGGLDVGFAVDHKPKASQRLRRLDLIARDPRVSLLVHDYDEDWRRLWWVRADGTAAVVGADAVGADAVGADAVGADAVAADAGRRPALLEALAGKYPQYRERPPTGDAVLVAVERLTGWSGADLDAGPPISRPA